MPAKRTGDHFGAPVKILIHSINYLPELTGIGKFTGEMGTWLAARGHQVRVVTTPPYYPEWRIPPGYRKCWYARETIHGADVIRCPFWVPRRLSAARRVVHLASFSLSALPVLLFQALVFRPDVVFVVKPPAFSLPGGWLAGILGGARSWLHVQDFEVDAAFEMKMISGGWLRKLVLGLESWWMRRYRVASTISECMLEKLLAKGVAPDRAVLFPNWADTDSIVPLDHASPLRAELGLKPGTVVALYAGNMGDKQGLEIIVDAARRVADLGIIHFVLSGEGAARAGLEAAAQGLGNITFLPLQPIERLGELLGLADMHLLPQRKDAADLVMPSKLGGMLASGRPVIACAAPGTQVAAQVEGAGLVVPPEDGAALAAAVTELAAAPGRRAALGRAARERALSGWSRETILACFEARLRELTDSQ
jgi:colanic acid biosynthesis glycosyl transferase WcaI